ncbi:MAG TPA: glycosyltransferase family 2 protein [Phycisphaerae bacterium]|jgi:dTDP-glucose pyrophosphorylase
MKVLIPMSGSDKSFQDAGYQHCKSLIEINGKALIQHIYENLLSLKPDQFIFVIRKEDHARHHLSDVLALMAPGCRVIVAEGSTAGAACTALLAVAELSDAEELVITNSDQIIRRNLFPILEDFRGRKLDAGTITFDSIHPRWSYVRVDDAGMVTEAAEKRPISRHATAGFYYFRRGMDFVSSAMSMIRKAAHVNHVYYVCPTFNEMILKQARVGIHAIGPAQYYSLASPQDVQRYGELLARREEGEHAYNAA